MKKILSIVLALLMLLSFAACGESEKEDEKDNVAVNTSGEPVGYYTDDVDHHARDTYEFVFIHLAVTQLCTDEANAIAEFQDALNFTITDVTANGDTDKLITMVEEYCIDGVDGLFIDAGYNLTRIDEICEEYEVNYMTLNNPLYNNEEDRVCIAPCVVIDSYQSGYELVDWLSENYKEYWGDIDTSKLGYIGGTFSSSVDIQYRVEGGKDSFLEHFPENEDNWFYADTITGNLNVDTAYDLTSSIISANKDIEYWFIVAAAGDIGTGAARAVEDLGLEDSILIGSVPGSTLMAEWQKGYEGCWVCCVDFTYLDMAAQALSGLIAMADGRATMDSLWAEKRAEGDERTKYITNCNVLTAETFKTFYSDLYASYGFEYNPA